MMDKALPIRIKEVENGFTTTVWDNRPSPAIETIHVYDDIHDLLHHIFGHFNCAGSLTVTTEYENEDE